MPHEHDRRRTRDGLAVLGLAYCAVSSCFVVVLAVLAQTSNPPIDTKQGHVSALDDAGMPDAGLSENVIFSGPFTRVIAVDRKDQSILLFEEHSLRAPTKQAYRVVHADGSTESPIVLRSRRHDRNTNVTTHFYLAEARMAIHRLEQLAKRFHLEGQWLPFVSVVEKNANEEDAAQPSEWHIRFGVDGRVEIDIGYTAWYFVREPQARDFVLQETDHTQQGRFRTIAPQWSDEIDSRISAGNSDDYFFNACYFFTATNGERRKVRCFEEVSENEMRCKRGLCLLWGRPFSVPLPYFSLVNERTGQELAAGWLDFGYGYALDVNDADTVVISILGYEGPTTIVDLATGKVLRGKAPDCQSDSFTWLDDRTLICRSAGVRSGSSDSNGGWTRDRRLMRVPIDDENIWKVVPAEKVRVFAPKARASDANTGPTH